ncbi:MAG: hypothetical protein ABI988_04285 [Nitrospirota bacterium]
MQTIPLNGIDSDHGYLRRIRFNNENGTRRVFPPHHFHLPALTVCATIGNTGSVELLC